MKKLLIAMALILFVGFASDIPTNAKSSKETTVYICTGHKATRYHSSSNCRGLNSPFQLDRYKI
ncbi:MAG: hypothetical protein RR383_10005 [Muribaculaceae bacterium]